MDEKIHFVKQASHSLFFRGSIPKINFQNYLTAEYDVTRLLHNVTFFNSRNSLKQACLRTGPNFSIGSHQKTNRLKLISLQIDFIRVKYKHTTSCWMAKKISYLKFQVVYKSWYFLVITNNSFIFNWESVSSLQNIQTLKKEKSFILAENFFKRICPCLVLRPYLGNLGTFCLSLD